MRPAVVCLVWFLLLNFLPLLAWSDQLIVEPEMGREPIINAINQAQRSVKMVMYGFTDQAFLKPLLQQKTKGRTVKIILERYPYRAEGENNKIVAAFNQNSIAWQGNIPEIKLIHQKTLILDSVRAIIMTFNFTHSTFKNERNFALILDDPHQVNEIESVFDSDWQHKTRNNYASTLLWSPENSRERLINIIKRTKKTIDIYAQNISDYKVVGALAKAAKKGVSVRILTSTKIRQKQSDYLSRAHVQVKRSGHYYIHAKAFIIDNQLAIVGSINLTRASLDDNRELAVVSKDATVIKQLRETFASDWKYAKKIDHFRPLADKKTILYGLRILKKVIGF